MSAEEELYHFERHADDLIANLSLWKKPLRSILSSLYLIADMEFSGGRFGKFRAVDPEKGTTILSRTSYLIDFLTQASCDIGRDLQDALNALDVDDFEGIKSALAYAHFCELMPFVRKGYLGVERQNEDFTLRHPSAMFAYNEQRDIVAAELSLATMERQYPFQVASLQRMIEGWPLLRDDDLSTVLAGAYNFYLVGVHEDDFVAATEYESVFRFKRDEFLRVRAALMALASWCIGMAAAAEAKSLEALVGRKDKWRCECMEWAAPLLRSAFVVETVQGLSAVPTDRVDAILAYFQEQPLHRETVISGDGYLAPLISIKDSFLFSPRALLTMLSERNLLYVLNKSDRVRFDEVVSEQLEPALLN